MYIPGELLLGRTPESDYGYEPSNYLQYRGKCKELCEQALQNNSDLTIVRGYYHDAFWGRQEHWWCVNKDGSIYDPSKSQFPDQNGKHEEFNGIFNCEQCGKEITEEEGQVYGNYIFCSGECIYNCVM